MITRRAGEFGSNGTTDGLVRRFVGQVATESAGGDEDAPALRERRAVFRSGSAGRIAFHVTFFAFRAGQLLARVVAFAGGASVPVRLESEITSCPADGR